MQCVHSWEGLHHFPSRSSCPCTSVAVGMDNIATVGEDGTINALRVNRPQPVWAAGMFAAMYRYFGVARVNFSHLLVRVCVSSS